MWSMSVLDMMACGKVVLVPRKNAFPEMFPEDYPFFFENETEFMEKLEYLENCDNSVLEEWGEKNRQIVIERFTWETQAKELSEYFYSMILDKPNEKTESVYKVIKEFGMATKGDIINKNTSDYHRQCSRAWNKTRIELMMHYGIKDDVEQEHTTFYMPDYDKNRGIVERPNKNPTMWDLRQKEKRKLLLIIII